MRDSRSGRFLPGESGNPGGRPKSLRDLLPRAFDRRFALMLRERALKGDEQAIRLLCERLWPALSRAELGGNDGKPIALEHVEQVAAETPTEVLRELRDLALRNKGNGSSPTEH